MRSVVDFFVRVKELICQHPWCALGVLAVFLFRLKNALAFNPYWGYDGGAHLNYIFAVADGRMPDPVKNYVAWHEPLYYFLMGGALRVFRLFASGVVELRFLSVMQVCLSMLVTWMSLRVARALPVSAGVAIGGALLWNVMSPMTQASVFVTNELLNYFFILTILWIFFAKIIPAKMTHHDWLVFGAIAGFALLTKITALIPLGLVALYVLFGDCPRLGTVPKQLRSFATACLLALVMVSPWYWYRTTHVLGSLSINNYEFLQKISVPTKHRFEFLTRFDTDVFKFPYWYSGGRGFWSMFYADTFLDYYGTLEHRDSLSLHSADRVAITHQENFVSRRHLSFAGALPFLAVVPLMILLWGLVRGLSEWRTAKTSLPFWASITTLAFVSALLYSAFRYPAYDLGIVKSIFIFPGLLPALIIGLNAMRRRAPWLTLFLLVYVAFLVPSIFIPQWRY